LDQLQPLKSFVLEGIEYKQGDFMILNGDDGDWFCRIVDIKMVDGKS